MSAGQSRCASLRRLAAAAAVLVLALVGFASPAKAEVYPVTTVHGISDGWVGSDVTFWFTVDGGDAGTTETNYRLDGVPSRYTGPVTVTAEGVTILEFQTHDTHTAREDWQTAWIRIDRTAPITSIAGLPSGLVPPGAYGFSLDASDGLSGVAATYYRVDNGPAVAYAGGTAPVLAMHGTTIEYWSVDAAGNEGGHRTALLRVDDGWPFTSLGGVPDGWTRGVVTAVLSATSSYGTITGTYYSLGGAPDTPYAGPITIGDEGVTTLRFHSTDSAGNTEYPRSVDVRIDRTPPSTSAGSPPTGWVRVAPSLPLVVSDGLSGPAYVWFGITGEPLSRYVPPASGSAGAEGIHEYTWYAADRAGNVEEPHHAVVMLDRTAPASSASGLPDLPASGPVTFALGAADQLSGVASIQYTLDGGPPLTYAGPVTISKHGITALTWWATDIAGNAEPVHTAAVSISTAGPTTTASGIPTGWARSDVTVTLSPHPGDLPISSTLYRVDQGAWREYSSAPVVVSGEGTRTLEWYSRDTAGVAEALNEAAFGIDRTPPRVTATVTGEVYRRVVSLSASDALSGVAHLWWSVNGGPWVEGASLELGWPGFTVVAYRATDVAWNVSAAATIGVSVETMPPTGGNGEPPVTIADVRPSYVGTATIHLSASSPTTASVARTCYRLDGGVVRDGMTIVVSEPGTHTVEYWSVDSLGNVESPHSAVFAVVTDEEPPGPPGSQATSISIASSARVARIGASFVLSGRVTPAAATLGRVMHVDVKKPNRMTWSYSSARRIYAAGGASCWWYRYVLVRGMVRGTYRFHAVFDGDGVLTRSASHEIAVLVR